MTWVLFVFVLFCVAAIVPLIFPKLLMLGHLLPPLSQACNMLVLSQHKALSSSGRIAPPLDGSRPTHPSRERIDGEDLDDRWADVEIRADDDGDC